MKNAHCPGQFRLAEQIANRRLLYPSPLISAPSVMVLDVPEGNRGADLALGRYYPVIVETEDELAEFEGFLNEMRPAPIVPDLLDRRPSHLWSGNILVSRYEPPLPGWPWLCVVRWPEAYSLAASEQGIEMARGCYTMALFDQAADLDAHCVALLENLSTENRLNLRLLSAERLGPPGHA